MHIVIPMSGVGKRFIDAGYIPPKPLIEINGKTIIQHVIELFPGETKFTFICNEEHAKTTHIKDILANLVDNPNIITIPNHKLGPVFAVQQIYNLILDDEEVIVNYCDFGTYWNYHDFLIHTRTRNADGAIVAYKNFHPHMLGSTNYAFLRDEKQWMLEIQEKKPYTDDKMQEYASNGTYYFKNGKFLKQYFDETIKSGEDLNGEYYVSVVYNRMKRDSLNISIYEIQHMLQWGTPQDVEDFLMWSKYFESNQKFLSRDRTKISIDNLVIPMAGEGSRFKKAGFKQAKPFININGHPMMISAISSLPGAKNIYLGIREEHASLNSIDVSCADMNKHTIVPIHDLTDGQATTCERIIQHIPNNENFIIAACDNGMVWDEKELDNLIDEAADVIIWAFKGHPHAVLNPEQYGWIQVDGNTVKKISVKKAISKKPQNDFGVVGAFYFNNKEIFLNAYDSMRRESCKINGEFYVDMLINFIDKEKFNVKILTVEHFICWGTPDDYNTFNYWQSYFHKSNSHPYNLKKDFAVNDRMKEEMINEYYDFHQEYSD